MEITDKLTRPIVEVNYLRAENAPRYRVILRAFYEEYEKINYWLNKEDVFQIVHELDAFPNYTMEQCVNDLNALVEWNNLTAIQDTSKVSTIQEFKNRKFRYQLSEYSIEIERLMIRLENMDVQGASLEPTLLERIRQRIEEIPNLAGADELSIHTWWNDLNADFIRLNQNYQDYIRTLNSSKAEQMMQTTQFLVFKDKIIHYLRQFVKELQQQAMVLEYFIQELDPVLIEKILDKAIQYELSIPRIDGELDEKQLQQTFYGRWKSMYRWFVGKNGVSEVSRMSDITSQIIRKITRYAQQIGEYHNQGANRIEEYRHLFHLFGQCEDMNAAHKMSAMVFCVDHSLHLKNLRNRDTESIDSGVYEETSSFVQLEPRTRIATKKSVRKAAKDHTLERLAMKYEIMEQQEKQQAILDHYLKQQEIDFKSIGYLDAYSRKLLLGWLTQGLLHTDHKAKLESGQTYYVDTSDTSICKVCCEDGDFYMPSFKICFEKDIEHE